MPKNPLEAAHKALGAFMVERAGTPMPARYGDVDAEHEMVRRAAGVFDLCSAGKLVVRGEERERFLDAVLAADLAGLAPGRGAYSLLLSREGRVAAEARVLATEGEVVLLTPSLSRSKLRGVLERHVAASEVSIADESEARALVSVQGPAAGRVLAAVLGVPTPELQPFGSVVVSSRYGDVLVAASPRGGESGLDLVLPAADAEAFFSRLVECAKKIGGGPAGLEALDALRVEAGIPAYGADFDETTLPTEIDETPHGFSMEKGCCLGRDALVHAMAAGPATRRLAGVLFEGMSPPVRGDKLFADGKAVGAVTSGAVSPSISRPIGLAMIAVEHTAVGTQLLTSDGGTALVSARPFVGNA